MTSQSMVEGDRIVLKFETIYVYICVCVYVCVCIFIFKR